MKKIFKSIQDSKLTDEEEQAILHRMEIKNEICFWLICLLVVSIIYHIQFFNYEDLKCQKWAGEIKIIKLNNKSLTEIEIPSEINGNKVRGIRTICI